LRREEHQIREEPGRAACSSSEGDPTVPRRHSTSASSRDEEHPPPRIGGCIEIAEGRYGACVGLINE